MVRLGRACRVVLFASLVVACSTDGGSGGDPVLLSEDFGTADLSGTWVVATTAQCSAASGEGDALGSPPQGNPTPGLVFKCTGALSAPASSVRTIDTYVLDRPHTFRADARVDAVGTFGSSPQPGLDIAIEALNTGALYASVWVRPDGVTYYIRTSSGSGYVQVTRAHAADGLFHQFEFTVDGNGAAEWKRDGALQVNTTIFSGLTGNYYLRLRAPPSTAAQASEGHADNVRIIRS